MKKMNRKSIIMASAMASALCVGVAASTMNVAAAEEIEISNFYIAGGSVSYMSAAQAEKDENGIRFAVAMEDNLFASLLTESGDSFKTTVKAGALVLPADLTEDTVLTKETVVSDGYSVKEEAFAFENFSGEDAVNELAGVQLAYVTLQNFPVSDYNRVYMVSAYYQVGDGEIVYTETVTACMAQIAKAAAQAETDEDRQAGLLSYVKEYAVNVYIDGGKDSDYGVVYGEFFDAEQLPVGDEGGYYAWFADEDYETPFDFETPILGTTNVYGKKITIAEQTGVLTSMDETFVYDAETKTLTQTLRNSVAKKGYAQLAVEAGSDFYVSADISLTKWFKVASQGWNVGENDRLGFALVNENGENYRMQLRSVMMSVQAYAKSATLYGGDGVVTYLLGSTNSTTNDAYKEAPYIQLKNTSNLNSVPSVNIALEKAGSSLCFYVNNELVSVQEIEADFNGVPALFAYSFADAPEQVVTYSNIVIKTGVAATYSDKTSDFTIDENGVMTHTLKKNADGFAKFDVDGTKDYTIRFTASFFDKDGNPATAAPGYDDATAKANGKNNRVGVTFFDETNSTYYNYGYSMMWYNAVRIINTSEKSMYNDSDYKLADDSSARASFYGVRDKFTAKNDTQVNIMMKKVGNTISLYINNYLLETLTVADGANVIPAILSYDLQDSTNPITVSYSNVVIFQ